MSNAQITNSIVSIQWLAENLSAENLFIFDASMKPIVPAVDAAPETPAYIPGALRFDFDDVLCDHNTSLPHMMPSPEFFADEMQKMGVDHDSAIVVYDKVGIYSSPRAWWMFKAMGHDQVAVLDGGPPAWIQDGYKTTPTLTAPKHRGDFASRPQGRLFVDSKTVLHALTDSAFSVMDARSAGRFKGQEPEPGRGCDAVTCRARQPPLYRRARKRKMSSKTALRKIFGQYKDKQLIFSCGTGVIACELALAAEQAGLSQLAVYDGSWSEWGR